MTPQELRANRHICKQTSRLIRPLLSYASSRDAARQLLRASAGTAANYRATCLARSHAEFTAKLGVTLEECDESVYWLEHLVAAGLMGETALSDLLQEAKELGKILGASRRTSTARRRPPQTNPARGARARLQQLNNPRAQ